MPNTRKGSLASFSLLQSVIRQTYRFPLPRTYLRDMNISAMLKFFPFVSKSLGLGVAFFWLTLAVSQVNAQEKVAIEKNSKKPLSVLLVTGGCCHDYDFQSKALQLAAKERGVLVEWTIVNQGGKGTKAMIDLYKKPNWQEGFDVVIHNECFADTDDTDYIRSITKPHFEGTNAVVIHCAMHTYRSASIDDWREFLGVTSRHHEHQSRYPITVVQKDHPIMKDFPVDSKSAMDELYIIEKVWPATTVLATSKSEKTGEEQPVYWTNQYGKGRVFGTTYGHSNDTFSDKAFLNAVVNGIVWAAGK